MNTILKNVYKMFFFCGPHTILFNFFGPVDTSLTCLYYMNRVFVYSKHSKSNKSSRTILFLCCLFSDE